MFKLKEFTATEVQTVSDIKNDGFSLSEEIPDTQKSNNINAAELMAGIALGGAATQNMVGTIRNLFSENDTKKAPAETSALKI